MHRLSTQFDTQAARRDESAAAGGSTSTTCSSCIVTLGTTSVLTSMYFSAMGKKEAPVPAVAEAPATRPTPWKWIGFFLPLATILLSSLFGAMLAMGGEVGLVVSAFLGPLIWIGTFVYLHQRIGKSSWGGVLAGMIGLTLMGGGVVLEVVGWLAAL